VADRHNDYAEGVAAELRAAGVRVEVDDRSESVGKKIRAAELRKAPYMLIVGDRELEAREVSVRSHEEGDLGAISIAAFAERVEAESARR
jgi:threonyl-tRNA synthetase